MQGKNDATQMKLPWPQWESYKITGGPCKTIWLPCNEKWYQLASSSLKFNLAQIILFSHM